MWFFHCELRFLHKKTSQPICAPTNITTGSRSPAASFPRGSESPATAVPALSLGRSQSKLSMGWAPRAGEAEAGGQGVGRQLICFLLYFLLGPDQESILGFFGI